jgi:beta-glucanase (GH16 family)
MMRIVPRLAASGSFLGVRSVWFLLAAAAALSTTIAASHGPPPQSLPGSSETTPVTVPFEPSRWILQWADEFDGGPAPDPRIWSYEVGYVRNKEEQFYTSDRRDNARVENGRLMIEARRDGFEGHPITSASLHTAGKRPLRYGRIEVRAKIPTGRGTWPAIWTLGENRRDVGWPRCGEIDIMENVGFAPGVIHANIHTAAYNHTRGTGRGSHIDAGRPWDAFHVYAVEWWPDRLEFFLDDTRYFVYRKERDDEAVWPFDQPHYLILNLAIGGAWGGQKGVDPGIFPVTYEIDYVRYFTASSGSARSSG